ncbi:hypothetical protein BD413DRAFT_276255 [Trametes elegans]|nr:hypothetical protein BD413DRAFT_276255 [Trametes elegans]
MAPSRQLASGSQKVAKCQSKPYSNTRRRKKDAIAHNSVPTNVNPTAPFPPRETTRDVMREAVRSAFPHYIPRDDFDILVLSSGDYAGPPSEISKFIDRQLRAQFNSREDALREAAEILDEKADFTGLKPRPGDPGVFIQPIPKSRFSVRLFPGSVAASEYCLDFVVTATGQPVNSPFEFQLIAGPGPMVPLGTAPKVTLRPLECAFGIREDQIPPGEEKFLLRDGQICTLRRPGHRDVRFKVPMRKRPEPVEDVDFLEFPDWV